VFYKQPLAFLIFTNNHKKSTELTKKWKKTGGVSSQDTLKAITEWPMPGTQALCTSIEHRASSTRCPPSV